MPIKLVLDTNTIISAFFWEGNEAELLKRIEQGEAIAYTSEEILDEIKRVIVRPKFKEVMENAGLTPDQILLKVIQISQVTIVSNLDVAVCRDKEDNKFLECAECANANYIVSGDEDLLSLKEYQGVQIVPSWKILQVLKHH